LLNFDEFPIIIPIECPLNQQKYPISHFHIAGCREATREGGVTIWKSSTGWLLQADFQAYHDHK
jgi:hypothetical protein